MTLAFAMTPSSYSAATMVIPKKQSGDNCRLSQLKYPIGHYYLAHGGGGYTGKWIGRKGTFLEGGVRVPMIISYPKKLPRGIVRHQTITIMDWMPTLIELIGLPQPANPFDGYNILPIIKSANATSNHKVLHFDWREDWAVNAGRLETHRQDQPAKRRSDSLPPQSG